MRLEQRDLIRLGLDAVEAMRGLVFCLLLVAGSALDARPAAPRWNPKAPENAQQVPRLTLAAVESVLTSIGARSEKSGADAANRLLVTFANGRRAVVGLSACDQTGGTCKALSIQTLWNKPAGATPERTALAVAQFNRRYALTKATVASDGRPAIQRYLVADYGFIRGNLAVELLTYSDQAQRFVTEVLRPLEQPSR